MSSVGTKWAPDLGVRGSQVPPGDDVGMAANADPGEHDVIVLDASGNGVVCDGTQTGARCVGVMYPDKRSTVTAPAGHNIVRVWNGYGERMPMSASVGDSFTSNDRCVPCYISAERQVGKLALSSGVGRPLGGLTLRVHDGEAVTWIGDVAQAIARGVVIADHFTFAGYKIADASASTAISEVVIGRVNAHGTITSVAYTGAAFAADNTDYATGTIAKRSALDAYASATTIATFDSRAANQGAATAFTPYAWALSGTASHLQLVPGDVITLVTTKAGAGKSLSGVIDVVGKVI